MSTVEYVKKITMKALGVVRKDLKPGEKVEVARVAGSARGTKTAVTQYGESIGLVGNFTAMMPDGKKVKAPVMFCAGGFEAPIIEALAAGVEEVEFVVAIYATGIEAKAGGSNYQWSFAPLADAPQESAGDRLLRLAQDVPVLKLAAPEQSSIDV